MADSTKPFLLKTPLLVGAGAVALYLGLGFVAVPALLSWQLEKQVREQYGHSLSLGEVGFNPLNFQLSIKQARLTAPDARLIASFESLLVDFELRSVLDQTWTFSQVVLESPVIQMDVDREGRSPLVDLLARFQGANPAPQTNETTPLPAALIQQLALHNGQLVWRDQRLAEPLITRIAPLQVSLQGLSTKTVEPGQFDVTAVTGAGETLALSGTLGLSPWRARGELAIDDLQVASVARALSRWFALETSTGRVMFKAGFDLGATPSGELQGQVRDIAMRVAQPVLQVTGDTQPLVALGQLSLTQGQLDLARRTLALTEVSVSEGLVHWVQDAQGKGNWARAVRPSQVSQAPADDRAHAPAQAPMGPPWHVALDKVQLSDINFHFSDAARQRHVSVQGVQLASGLQLEAGPAGTDLNTTATTLRLGPMTLTGGVTRVSMSDVRVSTPAMALSSTAEALDLNLNAPAITLKSLALTSGGNVQPRSAGRPTSSTPAQSTLSLGALEISGQRVALEQRASGLVVRWPQATWRASEWRAQQADQLLLAQEVTGDSEALTIQTGGTNHLSARVTNTQHRVTQLQALRGDDRLHLAALSLQAGSLDVAQGEQPLRLKASDLRVSTSDASLAQSQGRMALANMGLDVDDLTVSPSAVADEPSLQAKGSRLSVAQLQLMPAGVAPVELGEATASVRALALRQSDGPLGLQASGVDVTLLNALVQAPDSSAPWLRFTHAALVGGELQLPQRLASANTLTLSDGNIRTWLDAQGSLNWLNWLNPVPPAAPVAAVPLPTKAPVMASSEAALPAEAPWRLTLKDGQLNNMAIAFEDQRASSALRTGLNAVQVQVANMDSAGTTPMTLNVNAEVSSGGHAQVQGSVQLNSGALDLGVTLSTVALAPAQAYLSQWAKLSLGSGQVSASGRLRHGGALGVEPRWAYEGAVSIDQFRLDELAPLRPFLAWDSVATDALSLTLGPDNLRMNELRVDGLAGRLMIAADQSVNLTDVLVKRTTPPDGAAPAGAPGADATAGEEPQADIFPVNVGRVRVSNGLVEFSDQSLRPPFAARMHQLQGVITGLGTGPLAKAQVQLDAQVDKFGSATIRGQASVRQPELLTEIDLTFRNLAMTTLSPYVAKFAGYRIDAGRLDLDLQYKVRDSKLLGENKVVLKQVELGPRVDDSDAPDLPLALALAILKDADGVIDIALPVRGDLNDPQFDYGAVIGKAFGNLLGSIVTAPFRALGALFGGSDDSLASIEFAPGRDQLSPPQRHKLDTLARALKERPLLTLVLSPSYARAQDTVALRSWAVRTRLVQRMGMTLAAGEDPGPMDSANPQAAAAIEAEFSARYQPEVLAYLKQRAQASTPADGNWQAEFHQGLLKRLMAEEPLTEATLEALGRQRAQAIQDELVNVAGVPATRLRWGKPRVLDDASDSAVTLPLELEATR